MRSGELAQMAGVSVRALRHYHAIGLLPEPARGTNGYRHYDATHLLRVLRIRQLASLGFSLEQIGPMIDELDAERCEAAPRSRSDDGPRSTTPSVAATPPGTAAGAPDSPATSTPATPLPAQTTATASPHPATGGSAADGLLLDLDRQLAQQIERLQEQRELIARILAGQADPDYPERAARALEAIDAFENEAEGHGFLLGALTDDDKLAMGIAAHLYTDAELAEIERIFRAIPERDLTPEYLRVSRLMDALPDGATRAERERAIEAGMAFLDKISDCFDPENWLRPAKDYDRMLEHMAMDHYSDAQIAASDELFIRFTRRLAERAPST